MPAGPSPDNCDQRPCHSSTDLLELLHPSSEGRSMQTYRSTSRRQTRDIHSTAVGHSCPQRRLKSRRSFMTEESLPPKQSTSRRLERWKEWDCSPPNDALQAPAEQLPTGTDLPRKDWAALNRARAGVGKTASSLHKWGLETSSECPCGHPKQTVQHILLECPQGPHCTDQDLRDCNQSARCWIDHWRYKI